jgi:hypothetical protein
MNCCFNCSLWMVCLDKCSCEDNEDCLDGCDCPYFMPYEEDTI